MASKAARKRRTNQARAQQKNLYEARREKREARDATEQRRKDEFEAAAQRVAKMEPIDPFPPRMGLPHARPFGGNLLELLVVTAIVDSLDLAGMDLDVLERDNS